MSNEPIYDTDDIVDNQGDLPGWWMTLFWGAIAWSILYFIWLHPMSSWNQHQMYSSEIELYQKEHPVQVVELDAEGHNPLAGNAAAIAAGEKTFKTICAACHKADGTGLIGPNLMDGQWLQSAAGSSIDAKEMFNIVMNGIDKDHIKQEQKPPQGGIMPAHSGSLGAKKTLEVMAYLGSKNKSIVE